MKEPNFLVRFLATIGIVDIIEYEKPDLRQRNEVKQNEVRIPIAGIIITAVIIGVIIFALSTGVLTTPSTQDSKPKVNPDPEGSEREIRAYWQVAVQEMDCLELKRMIELQEYELNSNAWMFAKWEYENNDRLFPSPRDGCFKETGYLDDATDACIDWGAFTECDEYLFPREIFKDGRCVIHFPNDWFYMDLVTKEKFEDPDKYLKEVNGENRNCVGVKDA